MSQKRKWSASEKFKIALLAIKNEMTISDICKQYQVAPCQVHEWKKKLLEQGENLFVKNDKAAQAAAADAEKKQNKLFEKIGELTVERDFLKKSLGKLP